jgi:erythromycin esterase
MKHRSPTASSGRALALAFALILGCGAAPPRALVAPPPTVAEQAPALRGRVVDALGAPVANARVAAVPPFDPWASEDGIVSTKTGADGTFAFAALPAGKVAVTATASGKSAAYGAPIEIESGKSANVSLSLGGDGRRFSGTVSDEHGALADTPVSVVELSAREGSIFTVSTDAAGHYEIMLDQNRSYLAFVAAPRRPRTWQPLDPKQATNDIALEHPRVARPADDRVRAWLNANAMALSTDDPAAPGADLEPVAARIGGARLVAIGEATHGSRELFRLRHRLFEHLVEREGFTVFALEAGVGECNALNDYVLGGAGDPAKLLRGLFTDYVETEEWRDLIEWMRRWNAQPKHEKVHFEGFDVVTVASVRAVVEAIRRVDPHSAKEVEAALSPLASFDADGTYAEQPDAVRAVTRRALESLVGRFRAEKDGARLEHHVEVLLQATETFVDPLRRDAAMASNVEWITRRYPGARIVLSMHLTHAAKKNKFEADLGARLSRTFGADYVVVATGFEHGAFRCLGEDPSKGIQSFSVDHPGADNFDAALALAEPSLYAIDLRGAEEPVRSWLASPMPAWSVGFRFVSPTKSTVTFTPSEDFDLVIFSREVSAAHALAR